MAVPDTQSSLLVGWFRVEGSGLTSKAGYWLGGLGFKGGWGVITNMRFFVRLAHPSIHTYLHAYLRTYIQTDIHTCIRTYVYTYTHMLKQKRFQKQPRKASGFRARTQRGMEG